MSSTPKSDKHVSGGEGGGKGGGGRLARRARSFKEDFLEILAGMRSPGGGSGAANAQNSAASASSAAVDGGGNAGVGTGSDSLRELESLLKQVRFALRHFGDVVNKNTLEMLPGNGTVVLETVAAIHNLLKNFALDGQSSTVASATNLVYQSVARLIKVCDDVLIRGEAALNKDEATQVCELVGDAVQNLVSLVRDKMTAPRPEAISTSGTSRVIGSEDVAVLDVTFASSEKRNGSLPEIPLSPRERLILEQTSRRRGGSSDGDSPPPKPPLPSSYLMKEYTQEPLSASSSPPPLPPKRRSRNQDDRRSPGVPGDDEAATLDTLDTTGDGASLRSRSPDTSSLLSAGSLDSVQNPTEESLAVITPAPSGPPIGILVRTPSPQERSSDPSPSHRIIGTEKRKSCPG